jgi:hypothetical protein
MAEGAARRCASFCSLAVRLCSGPRMSLKPIKPSKQQRNQRKQEQRKPLN